MADKYLVVIIWDYYETSEIEFDTYDRAKDYFNDFKEFYRAAENIYLTKVLEEKIKE